MTDIRVKRIYDDPASSDGVRVLVDGVWPRGLSKENAQLDHWYKEVAPSSDLRKWYGHDPQRWSAFCERYRKELKERQPDELKELKDEMGDADTVTLLFSSKETERNNAVALAKFLQKHEV